MIANSRFSSIPKFHKPRCWPGRRMIQRHSSQLLPKKNCESLNSNISISVVHQLSMLSGTHFVDRHTSTGVSPLSRSLSLMASIFTTDSHTMHVTKMYYGWPVPRRLHSCGRATSIKGSSSTLCYPSYNQIEDQKFLQKALSKTIRESSLASKDHSLPKGVVLCVQQAKGERPKV